MGFGTIIKAITQIQEKNVSNSCVEIFENVWSLIRKNITKRSIQQSENIILHPRNPGRNIFFLLYTRQETITKIE